MWMSNQCFLFVIPTEAEGSHRVRAVQEKTRASTVRVSQCDGSSPARRSPARDPSTALGMTEVAERRNRG
jgi:hypothetical protein